MKDNLNYPAIDELRSILYSQVSVPKERAAAFFKTGSGHYAEGDEFIGVTVPDLRKIAKDFLHINLLDVQLLLASKVNEERLLALLILVHQYTKAKGDLKEEVYQFYLSNLQYVNNWNLVDSSAHLIMGAHLKDKDRTILLNLAKSGIIWERRIAMVATWHFIRKQDLEWTFKVAEMLLGDKHDLIHKAVGWMLREAGKRNLSALVTFLDQHAAQMPRTMLRYAIEKLSVDQRKAYLLQGKGRKQSLLS
jgi:3-methyladenine DNA glycosylase AlkD